MFARHFNMRRIGFTALCVAAATFGYVSPARAQVFASSEIGSDATGNDPHPITYGWSGEKKSIKEPVQYYTFFYTGKVGPDATVPVGTKIERIAVPINDWDLNKRAIITQLTTFYAAAFSVQAPAGNEVAMDVNFQYVERQDTQPNQAGIDPRAAAEWDFYLDQFVLWQFYCRRVLLNDRDAPRASSSSEDLQRTMDRQALSSIEGIDVDKVLDEADKLRKAQADGAKPGGPGGTARTPSRLGGGGAGGGFNVQLAPNSARAQQGAQPQTPQQMAAASLAMKFDPDAIHSDPTVMSKYRDEFIKLAEAREKLAMNVFTDMLTSIDKRKNELDRYNEWLTTKQNDLLDFARAWAKVQTGERVNLDQTFYLITKEPLDSVPNDARNVIRRDVLTPQDLIRKDGRLKGPQSADEPVPPAPAEVKPEIKPEAKPAEKTGE